MAPGSLVCHRCGWQNEATARMCGGCGHPLRVTDPAATVAVPSPGTTAAGPLRGAYGAPYEAAPTQVRMVGLARWPDSGGAVTPRAAYSSARRNGGLGRAVAVFVVVLVVLAAGLLGAWVLVIRPAAHTAVDSALRSALDQAVTGAADGITIVPNGQYAVRASTLETELQHQLPAGSHISDVHLNFAGGGVHVTYTFWGRPGSISTHLIASDGRVEARGTTVDDALSLVESGDEMEATLNDALSHLPSRYRVADIQTRNDTLVVTIGG